MGQPVNSCDMRLMSASNGACASPTTCWPQILTPASRAVRGAMAVHRVFRSCPSIARVRSFRKHRSQGWKKRGRLDWRPLCFWNWTKGLKLESELPLNRAGSGFRCDLAKRCSSVGRVEGQARCAGLRMVQDIGNVRPELKRLPFGDLK